jgi:RNA polymerase sigma factor (sigma-70 family)
MTLSTMAVAPSHVDEAPLLAAGLFDRHAAALRGFCAQRTANRADAEEAVQATFLRALRAMRQGVRPRSERAWLLTIARNVCATQATSAYRRREVALDPSVLELGAEDTRLDGVDPELVAALDALPDGQRRAFVLRAVDGLSYREIAGELGVTEAAVETWIFRARRKLAAAVGESRRRLASLSSPVAALKSLLGGSAALKAAAAASVVVATGVSVAPVVRDRERAPAPPKASEPAPVTPAPQTRRAESRPGPRTAPSHAARLAPAQQPTAKNTTPPASAPAHVPTAVAPTTAPPPEPQAPSPTSPPAPMQEVTDTVTDVLQPVTEAELPPVVLPALPPVPELPVPTDVVPVDVPSVELPPLLP